MFVTRVECDVERKMMLMKENRDWVRSELETLTSSIQSWYACNNEHIKRLFFYIIELSQYLIIMNLSWLCHHVIDVNFKHNILILSFFFCFNHCYSFFIKIYDFNQQEENFSFKVNKVTFFQSHSQFTHKKQLSSWITHKKQFSLQIAHKK